MTFFSLIAPMSWVQQQMNKGMDPRSVLTEIFGSSGHIPEGVPDFVLWHIIINMLSEPPKREKLRHINRIEDVIRLIKSCRKIIVLTGAGVSIFVCDRIIYITAVQLYC